jgi:peptide/nickel transport system substrate-binding protein
MYDSLITLDSSSDAVPWAAEKWEAAGPTTWRFTLKKGLTFHNGDPVTAADVEFTGKQVIANRWPLFTQLGQINDVVARDEYTIDFLMRAPDSSILPGLAALWILPKKYYESVGKDGFTAKPIGSGPFELVEFRNGDIAKFKKRAAAHPFRTTSINELTIRSIQEATAMAAGFRTGEIDILIGQVSPEQVERLKDEAQVEFRYPGVGYGVFSKIEAEQRNTPLQNIKVRQAINYAIDREAIAKTVFRGYAKPVGQFSVPGSLSWVESIQPFPYDPAMARRLLSEAGYPNGFTLPAGMEFTPQTTNPQMATAIQGYLRDVGIQSPLQSLELAVFLDRFNGRNNAQKGDIWMVTSVAATAYGTNQRTTHLCSRPMAWFCIPEYDRLMEGVTAEPDRARRSSALQRAIQLQRDEVAHIDLLAIPEFVVQQKNLRGFKWEAPNQHLWDSVYRVG